MTPDANRTFGEHERVLVAEEARARASWEHADSRGEAVDDCRFCNGLLLHVIERGATHLRVTADGIDQRVAGQWTSCQVEESQFGAPWSPRMVQWRLKHMVEFPPGPPPEAGHCGHLEIVGGGLSERPLERSTLFFAYFERSRRGPGLVLERFPGEGRHDPRPPQLVSLLETGTRLSDGGREVESQRVLQRALAFVESHPQLEPSALSAVLVRLGEAFEDQGLEAQAEAVYRRHVESGSLAGVETVARADALTTLGRFLGERGQLGEAERHLTEARSTLDLLFGSDHSRLWPDKELARLFLARGEVERSRAAAAAVLVRAQALDLPNMVSQLSRDLGLLEKAAGNAELAAGHFQWALDLQSQGAPPSLFVAGLQLELARARRAQGRASEARALLEEARLIFHALRGPGHPQSRELDVELSLARQAASE